MARCSVGARIQQRLVTSAGYVLTSMLSCFAALLVDVLQCLLTRWPGVLLGQGYSSAWRSGCACWIGSGLGWWGRHSDGSWLRPCLVSLDNVYIKYKLCIISYYDLSQTLLCDIVFKTKHEAAGLGADSNGGGIIQMAAGSDHVW
jgi:hypothetical protein